VTSEARQGESERYGANPVFQNRNGMPIRFDVTADVAIRFDDVQALLLEGNTAIKPVQARVMMSFGSELRNIAKQKQRRWTVRTEADLPTVAAQVAAAFLDIGRPYLKTYPDRRAALEVLAGDDQAAWLHMPLHGQRARLALALCVVLGERFRFETLLAQKLDFLAARKTRTWRVRAHSANGYAISSPSDRLRTCRMGRRYLQPLRDS
jgi:hypothetical protein